VSFQKRDMDGVNLCFVSRMSDSDRNSRVRFFFSRRTDGLIIISCTAGGRFSCGFFFIAKQAGSTKFGPPEFEFGPPEQIFFFFVSYKDYFLILHCYIVTLYTPLSYVYIRKAKGLLHDSDIVFHNYFEFTCSAVKTSCPSM
jgi:hypothetical protein